MLARLSYDYGSDVPTVLTVRFTLLCILLLIWNTLRKQAMRLPPRLAAHTLICGIFYLAGIGSYLLSVAYLPVSLAVLIFYTFPILVTVIAAVLARKAPGLLEILALMIAFLGLLIALNVQTDGLQWLGIALAVMASLGVAANTVFSGYLLDYMSTSVFSVYTSGIVALIAILLVIYNGGLALPESATGIIVFSGMLLTFGVGYIAIYSGIRLLGAAPLATIMNLEPVATIMIAAVLLGEVLNRQQMLGGLIVLAGILLAQWPQIKPLLQKKT